MSMSDPNTRHQADNTNNTNLCDFKLTVYFMLILLLISHSGHPSLCCVGPATDELMTMSTVAKLSDPDSDKTETRIKNETHYLINR